MPSHACPNAIDDSIGPSVRVCRHDFDFTLAFESIFFAICPSLVLQICAVTQIRWLLQRSRTTRPGFLRPLEMSMCLINAGLQISLLVVWTLHSGGARALTLTAAALSVLEAIVITSLSGLHHARSVKPSTVLQAYLVITLLFDIARARTLHLQAPSSTLANLFRRNR